MTRVALLPNCTVLATGDIIDNVLNAPVHPHPVRNSTVCGEEMTDTTFLTARRNWRLAKLPHSVGLSCAENPPRR
jgi:hypothetical protein